MSDWVACTNPACSERGIPKDNRPSGYALEQIRCGGCGQPVSESPAPNPVPPPDQPSN